MLEHYYQTKAALGSDITLTLVTGSEKNMVGKLFQKLWLEIYQFERRFSRFVPMSELSVFNRSSGSKVSISSEFHDILVVAKRLGEKTDGLYNPLILPALHRAGYTKSFFSGYEDDHQEDFSERKVALVSQIEIGSNWARIPYGTALDLGGCGKGYMADYLADNFMPEWIDGFWFSLGGDIVGGGIDSNGQPWQITVEDISQNKRDEWVITGSKKRFAVATSGTNIRKGSSAQGKWHHIIDPRTLKPAQSDVIQATVCGKNGVESDVLASCAVILGSANAPVFLKNHDVKSMLLQGVNKSGEFYHKKYGTIPHKSVRYNQVDLTRHA